jgi:hypothetical protein
MVVGTPAKAGVLALVLQQDYNGYLTGSYICMRYGQEIFKKPNSLGGPPGRLPFRPSLRLSRPSFAIS